MLLSGIGILLFIFSIGWLIFSLITKKGVRNPAIGLLLGIVLLVVGVATYDVDETEDTNTAEATEKAEKEEEIDTEDEELAAEKDKEEQAEKEAKAQEEAEKEAKAQEEAEKEAKAEKEKKEKEAKAEKEKKEKEAKAGKEKKEKEEEKTHSLTLDNLQQLYLDLENPTQEDIERLASEKNLVYSERNFSSGLTMKIAETEDVAKIKYADSGDHIKVSFNKENGIENIIYFNNSKHLTLIDYRSGTYWDFRDQPEYAGYYINKTGKELGSFTVKYDNGNEVNTGYLKVDSKEEQLKY